MRPAHRALVDAVVPMRKLRRSMRFPLPDLPGTGSLSGVCAALSHRCLAVFSSHRSLGNLAVNLALRKPPRPYFTSIRESESCPRAHEWSRILASAATLQPRQAMQSEARLLKGDAMRVVIVGGGIGGL